MWAKWNSLDFTQRFALGSIFLFLLLMPAAIYLALSPTSPFSKAGSCPISAPGCGEELEAFLILLPKTIEVNTNQEFTTEVVLNTGSDTVAAAEISLVWDNSLFKYVSFTPREFLPVVLEEATSSAQVGELSFVVGSTAENPVSGDGVIGEVKFQSLNQEGITSLAFGGDSQVAAIYKEVNVASQMYPAQVNISKSLASPVPSPSAIPIPSPSPIPSAAILDVSLTLENALSPSVATHAFTLTLEGGTSPVTVESEGLLIDGAFTSRFLNLEPGTYTAYVKSPGHLRKSLGEITLASGATNTFGTVLTLTAGDVVDNNTIDIFDYAVIVQDFGPRMPETGSLADLDLDGDVDIFDYSLIVQNFGKTGE